MTVTLLDIRTELERQLGDDQNTKFTVSVLNTYINDAYQEFCLETQLTVKEKGLQYTANSLLIDLPSDYIDTLKLYNLRNGTEEIKEAPLGYDSSEFFPSAGLVTGCPTYYLIIGRKMRLNAAISTAQYTTTLNGNLTSGATTIPVVDVSNFPSAGRILIDDEEIEYTSTDTTNNTFENCVRGVGETTPVSHTLGTTVTQLGLRHIYVYAPPSLSADTDTIHISDVYKPAIVVGAAYKLSLADNRKGRADRYFAIWKDWIRRGQRDATRRNSAIAYGVQSF